MTFKPGVPLNGKAVQLNEGIREMYKILRCAPCLTPTSDCWIVVFEPWDFPRLEVRGRLELLELS